MTNIDISNHLGGSTKTLGTIGITGVVTFAVVFAAMHAVQPDLDPVERFGSAYANGKAGWLMQVGIVAAGALAVAVGLRRSLEPGKRKYLGIWLLLIVAIGFAGLSQRLFFAIALAWLALLGLNVRRLGSAPIAHPDAGSASEQPVAAPTNQPPSVSNTGPRPTRSWMTRSRAALGSLGVVVALAASGSLVGAVAVASTDRGQTRPTHSADRLDGAATVPSRDATESDDHYSDCMRHAGGTPDTLERRVDACRAGTRTVADAHYLACMRDVGGTADTLEHWAGRCVQVAAAKARYEACLRDAGGTADAREHWVDTCRNRARP